MRPVTFSFILFIFIALTWALYTPLSSFIIIQTLLHSTADPSSIDQTLKYTDAGSVTLLRKGMASASPKIRLRCARTLALQGYREGDRCLAEILREHAGSSQDTLGGMSEFFLISLWEQRNAPEPSTRERLTRLETERNSDPDMINELNEALSNHPAWSGGYVRRARVFQRNGENHDARRDALIALMIDSQNFEAMVVLGRSYLQLDAPEQAFVCLEQAVRVNPRLKSDLKADLVEALKAIEIEKERRRRERRKDVMVVSGERGQVWVTMFRDFS